MSGKTKKKLCWNCEGNVDLKHETCPYCGVSLNISPIAGTKPDPKPPYRSTANSKVPPAPYPIKEEEKSVEEPAASNEFRSIAFSLTFLLLGSVLSIFSLILALFADANGIFTLRWQAQYWYIYLILAIPLLYFGWRASSQLNSAEEE